MLNYSIFNVRQFFKKKYIPMRFKECKRILSEMIVRREFYTKTNDPYMMLHKEYTTENHNLFIIISPLSIFIEN